MNVALTRIREITKEFASPPPSRSADSTSLPLGEFSAQLAELMPTAPGPGAGISAGVGGPGGRAPSGRSRSVGAQGGSGGGARGGRTGAEARPRLEIVDAAAPTLVDGEPILQLSFRVEPNGASAVRVSATPRVMTLDGGAVEREAPEGAAVPEVLGWTSPEGESHPGAMVIVRGDDEGTWILRVTRVPDALVQVELEAEPG